MQWLYKNRYLITRRVMQIGILLLFFLANSSLVSIANSKHFILQGDISSLTNGERNLAIARAKEPLLPFNILEGNLSGSKILGIIPMSDPLAFLQIFVAGGAISLNLALGAFVVLLI